MKFVIVFILFFLPCFSFSHASTQDIPEKVLAARRAVWKIHSSNNLEFGTGFFIGPRHFVTNFHVINGLLNKSSFKDFILSQEGNPRKLRVRRIISLWALHDLAILETEQGVSDYLSLSEEAIPQQKEDLYMIGYPEGSFKIMKRTGNFLYQHNDFYIITCNHSELSGASGSPVLNKQGQVLGVHFQGIENFSNTIKISHLRDLFEQKRGLSCGNLNPKSCVEKEMKNLKNLAKRGQALAQFNLAIMYHMEKNLSKATYYWYKKAAKQDHAIAQFNLARMYDHGKEVEKDLSKAVYWFEQAARQGYVPAQFNLAIMYDRGEGIEKNLSQAVYWYEQAANQGHRTAQFSLAVMYYKGEGAEKDIPKAVYWFEQAAHQSHREAQVKLAIMYHTGEEVKKDIPKAVYWFEQAAHQGHREVQFNLAVMYYSGKGVEKDLHKAAYWFEQAARQGHEEARFNLAVMYYHGQGMEKDLHKAAYWLEQAANQGHREAQANLVEVRNELKRDTTQGDSLDSCQATMRN